MKSKNSSSHAKNTDSAAASAVDSGAPIDAAASKQQTTHFGYKEVPVAEKQQHVAQVFSSVAKNYDVMNDVMSMGLHRLWKRAAVSKMQLRSGLRVLDLAGGSGDLTVLISKQLGTSGKVVLSDINPEMLAEGRKRVINEGLFAAVECVEANAEQLPFADNYFDRIVIGFGLRNVTDKAAALRSMLRVLKPGGLLTVLEFSQPSSSLLNKIYDVYSFQFLPRMGQLIAKDADSYKYLAESIRMHPDQDSLLAMLQDAGFARCRYSNLAGGIVAIHQGYKL